jgi:hypothetical protein
VFKPGRPFEIRAFGKTWTLGRMTLEMVLAFRDWIKERLSNPLEGPIAKYFDQLPIDEQIARVKKAEQIANDLACFSMASSLAEEYLRKEEGQAKWAQLWLSEHHPNIDAATAFAVFHELVSSGQLDEAMHQTDGVLKPPGGATPTMSLMTAHPVQGNPVAPAAAA